MYFSPQIVFQAKYRNDINEYTTENQNYYRICALVCEEATRGLRNVFRSEMDKYSKGIGLPDFLKRPDVMKAVSTVEGKVLNAQVMNALYPECNNLTTCEVLNTAESIDDLDLPLLEHLCLDVLCRLDYVQDGELAMNLLKLKKCRDALYCHVACESMATAEFKEQWEKLKVILSQQSFNVKGQDIDKWQEKIFTLGEPMDHLIKLKQILQNDAYRDIQVTIKNYKEKIDDTLKSVGAGTDVLVSGIERNTQKLKTFSDKFVNAIVEWEVAFNCNMCDEFQETLVIEQKLQKKRNDDQLNMIENLSSELEDLIHKSASAKSKVSDLFADKEMCSVFDKNLNEIQELKAKVQSTMKQRVQQIRSAKVLLDEVRY